MDIDELSAIKAKQHAQKIQQLENKIMRDTRRANGATRLHNLANDYVKLAKLTGQNAHYEEAISHYSKAIFLYKENDNTIDLRSHLKRALVLNTLGKADEAVSDLLIVLSFLDSDETVQNMVIASDIEDLIAHDAIKANIAARIEGKAKGPIDAEVMLKIIHENCSAQIYAAIKKPLMALFQPHNPIPEPVPAPTPVPTPAGPSPDSASVPTNTLSKTQLLTINKLTKEIESHTNILLSDCPISHEQIANLYQQRGDVTESFADYQKAIEWYSKSIDLQNAQEGYVDPITLGNRAITLAKMGNFHGATANLIGLLEAPWLCDDYNFAIYPIESAIHDLITREAVRNHIQNRIQHGGIDAELVLKSIGEHASVMDATVLERLSALFQPHNPAPALISSSRPMTFSASPNQAFLPVVAAPAVATPEQRAFALREKAKKAFEQAQETGTRADFREALKQYDAAIALLPTALYFAERCQVLEGMFKTESAAVGICDTITQLIKGNCHDPDEMASTNAIIRDLLKNQSIHEELQDRLLDNCIPDDTVSSRLRALLEQVSYEPIVRARDLGM